MANGELIARKVPGAQLHVVPHAGHYYSIDGLAVDGVVSSFLAGCELTQPVSHTGADSASAAGCAQCPYSR